MTIKRILIGIGAAVFIGAIVLGVTILRLISPTEGPRIEAGLPNTALIVMDMQRDYTAADAKRPFRDALSLITAINVLIEDSEKKGRSVIFIRNEVKDDVFHRMTTGGTGVQGTAGAKIDERLKRLPGFVEFVKFQGDAFSSDNLNQYLREARVGNLIITGIDAAYCVKYTIGGALNRGYLVTVAKDAVATESGKNLSALFEDYREMGAALSTTIEIVSHPDENRP